MAQANQYTYSFQEIAEALVKEQNIHEGHWGVFVRFGLSATNVGTSDQDLRPAAIIPITEMGIQRFEVPSNLTVDASIVNPKQED